MLVPVLYFGVQLAALPFAPTYNLLKQVASELGMSAVSCAPALFNLGTMLRAVVMGVAAVGFFFELRRRSVSRGIAVWVGLTMLAIAVNDFGAGIFPLPDRRHESVFAAGYLLWPPAILAATWHQPGAGGFKAYVMVNIAFICGLIGWRIASGDALALAGLFQRLLGVATVGPIGVASWFLSRRGPAPIQISDLS
ncbi:MAG: DUF998 domain-containing protein [Acidobacteria bacterium]|nr:DUF998 domain-containing protein [Acidobacteriota bacterium]